MIVDELFDFSRLPPRQPRMRCGRALIRICLFQQATGPGDFRLGGFVVIIDLAQGGFEQQDQS
jgi:hypothetical protein